MIALYPGERVDQGTGCLTNGLNFKKTSRILQALIGFNSRVFAENWTDHPYDQSS